MWWKKARYNSLYVELSLAIILRVERININIVYSYIPRCPFFVLICLFVWFFFNFRLIGFCFVCLFFFIFYFFKIQHLVCILFILLFYFYFHQFVSDLRQDRWFSPVFSTNKTDRHDIAEILLKVALNTITLTLNLFSSSYGNFVCTFVSTLTLLSNKCLEDNIFRNNGIVRPLLNNWITKGKICLGTWPVLWGAGTNCCSL